MSINLLVPVTLIRVAGIASEVGVEVGRNPSAEAEDLDNTEYHTRTRSCIAAPQLLRPWYEL